MFVLNESFTFDLVVYDSYGYLQNEFRNFLLNFRPLQFSRNSFSLTLRFRYGFDTELNSNYLQEMVDNTFFHLRVLDMKYFQFFGAI